MRDPGYVMRVYRRYVLGVKRKFGTARSLVLYRKIIQGYLEAKRAYLAARRA
mgnify:CR=1 FL=1